MRISKPEANMFYWIPLSIVTYVCKTCPGSRNQGSILRIRGKPKTNIRCATAYGSIPPHTHRNMCNSLAGLGLLGSAGIGSNGGIEYHQQTARKTLGLQSRRSKRIRKMILMVERG